MRSKKLFDTLHGTGGAASHRGLQGLFARPKKPGCLIAAAAAALVLCGLAAYGLGLFGPWRQRPSGDPVQAVQSALENQAAEDYTVSLRIGEIKVEKAKTEQAIARYPGSDLARARGWTDEYLAEHFVAVWAKYYAEYDHAKTFLEDGWLEQDFYLVRDPGTGAWEIADSTSPRASRAP